MLGFDPFRHVDRLLSPATTAGTVRSPRFMPMDLCRADDHYILTADLPGVDPGSVQLTIDNGTLTLSAERTAGDGAGVQWLASERPYGSYRRDIALGDGVDTAGIAATYQHGVLSVTIPLAAAAQPRSIAIEVLDTTNELRTGNEAAAVES